MSPENGGTTELKSSPEKKGFLALILQNIKIVLGVLGAILTIGAAYSWVAERLKDFKETSALVKKVNAKLDSLASREASEPPASAKLEPWLEQHYTKYIESIVINRNAALLQRNTDLVMRFYADEVDIRVEKGDGEYISCHLKKPKLLQMIQQILQSEDTKIMKWTAPQIQASGPGLLKSSFSHITQNHQYAVELLFKDVSAGGVLETASIDKPRDLRIISETWGAYGPMICKIEGW
jgi:hypothetical protein